MGRIRIKKKEAVIPLRETMAYRMILIGASLIVFMVALYILVGSISTNRTTAIASGVIGVAAAFGIFYNLDQLRFAKVPKRTMNRMKRR
jgi:1,4-dihydroxy-2-naphthoate octaprenyltransferase